MRALHDFNFMLKKQHNLLLTRYNCLCEKALARELGNSINIIYVWIMKL